MSWAAFQERWRRLWASVMVRLIATYILAVVLTAALVIGLTVILISYELEQATPQDYIFYAEQALISYKSSEILPYREPSAIDDVDVSLGDDSSFVLIVSVEGVVLYTEAYGGAIIPCQVGDELRDCAPGLLNRPPGERFIRDAHGEEVAEVVLDALTGERAIAHIRPFQLDQVLAWYVPLGLGVTTVNIPGVLPYALATSLFFGAMAMPAALLLMWVIGRPLAKRLARIAHTSRIFAAGDYGARVRDESADEVGQVARQFNDMAAALQQNVQVLRDLAQQNTALLDQAETAAIQAERMRLSRDLHDAIAQRLFSLTVSTASLPDLIERDQLEGAKQARAIAGIAEQTLLDLRGLLVNLRPSVVVQKGLPSALRQLCMDWETAHKLPVEVSMILRSEALAPGIENTLYYVAQEALNNVAKHASASRVSVSVLEKTQDIIMSISDDGVGIQPKDAASNGHHIGMVSMRERAHAIGGELQIESEAGNGTTIFVRLPISVY
ncbi:MAG: sensor histidine kinase [Chloroflexota bacterium]|nr:sensor histidine kinase [Chloroflexota bacterium]